MRSLVLRDEPPFRRIGIVGLGLIGASIALAVRRAWPGVTLLGVDRPEVLEKAESRGLVDQLDGDLSTLASADLAVLCAPVGQNLRLLPELGWVLQPGAVMTDAGSTKLQIVEAASTLSIGSRFVGGHPLGGAAFGGLEHASADLFRGRPWILTPTPTTDTSAVDTLRAWVTALGAAPAIMTAEEHDRLVAFVSHLPQLVASALMTVVGDAVGADGLALAGRGLADTTRLASSPADIWRDIASSNADRIAPALDALIAVLTDLRGDLADGARLDDVFSKAARWRSRLTARETI